MYKVLSDKETFNLEFLLYFYLCFIINSENIKLIPSPIAFIFIMILLFVCAVYFILF